MQTKDVSGTIIDFRIGRPYGANPAEAHKISFYIVGGGKSAFLDETSDTNTLCVDKIRATYGGGLMYFDVHYNASSANEVLVYFDVYGKGQANGTSIAMGLASVADAPTGETVLTTYTFAADCTPEARVLLWNNWNTSDVSPQTINMDLSRYKFIEVVFAPFSDLTNIQCQRCLVGPSSSSAYTATLQYYFLRTDATGTASVTAVSRGLDVYSSGIVIGNGQMLYSNTKYNDWPSRCRPLQIWGIR
jgi:hypothetical protein